MGSSENYIFLVAYWIKVKWRIVLKMELCGTGVNVVKKLSPQINLNYTGIYILYNSLINPDTQTKLQWYKLRRGN
jgi:hypothetical protein